MSKSDDAIDIMHEFNKMVIQRVMRGETVTVICMDRKVMRVEPPTHPNGPIRITHLENEE